MVRIFVDRVADPFLEDLLSSGWQSSRRSVPGDSDPIGGILDVAASFVDKVDLSPVRPALAQAVRLLRRHGIALSDRRIVRTQRLIAAAAVLDSRTLASPADLWPLVLAIPTHEDQLRAEEILQELLTDASNRVATAAAEETSHGPAARAARLVEAAREVLAAHADEARQLRLEGLAREIDSSFAGDALPPELAALRSEIVEALGE